MKKKQSLLFLLMMIILGSCYSSKHINYSKMNSIQHGMSTNEVIAILGKPTYRSFNDKGEMLEFRDYAYAYGTSKVVKVWFSADKVIEMKSYLDKYINHNCDKESDDEGDKKTDSKETSTTMRMTPDGKQLIQTGSIITTPDGKQETIISDANGAIVTFSGEIRPVL